MFRQADGLIFSATDLNNYLGCRHATFLDLTARYAAEEDGEADAQAKLIMRKGLEHEERHLASLIASGRDVFLVEPQASLEERVAQTLKAMHDGADVIYQGALLDKPWHGYADFLVRVNGRTRLGPHGYEVVDTKLAREPQPKHVIQLCVYAKLLAAAQDAPSANVHLVLGDKREVSFPLAHFFHYAELAQRRLEAFATTPPKDSFGEPCGHCPFCRWRSHCEGEWDRVDHLSRVANISKSQIAKLKAAGVDSMKRLASIPAGDAVEKLHKDTLVRLNQQARLQDFKRRTGENKCEVLAADADKGFARLPKPDPGDLFFDMEGDPLIEDGLEYLFGCAFSEVGKPCFKSFWGHTRDEEKRAFEQAVDFIAARLRQHPNAYVYHYASYEEAALKRLSLLHGTREAEIDDLLRKHKLVDLYKVVREAIRVSEPSYSLKNLETFYMEKREGDVKGAADSIVAYEQWREIGDPALLRQIGEYNATDCRSTLLLRDWLLTLRPKGLRWYAPEPEAVDPKNEEERSEAQARLEAMSARLLRGVVGEKKPFRMLVSQLLEFHRREAKPQWWMMFHRQELAEDELIDDADCIGGLTRDPACKPETDKQSLIHRYRFPAQDFKLREGESPLRADTGESAGTIWELDEEAGRIALRIGRTRELPDCLSLIPGGPLDSRVLRGALYRYAEAVAAEEKRYTALTSFLQKEYPAVTGIVRGAPLIDGATEVAKAVEVIRRLDSSYLLVQGPPGAGKTFTASHAIVELLARGKRVGVSSNSHKAIVTLLKEVEDVAIKRKVKFRGVKKCSADDHALGGRYIEDVWSNDEVFAGNYQLIAGTAWLFAREELDQALDTMFVDEAGQVSIASVVAMGVSARNLVLIGDQMQLAQPTQGVHPGESGCSALEFALGERATVPPERGIFLDRTRRMHPDVCRFVSDAFYDGRLQPDAGNERQRLVLGRKPDVVLAPTGIRFVEVEHTGCSQKSEIEAERVAAAYRSLLKQRWIDREGKEAALGTGDILVVSPYNMQVDELRRRLPDGARVGTVDKFQGQQAPAVLISMAASSAEDSPRGIDFLFSRNRLNVAISRARCLAVIFASPRLLEARCTSVDQLRLADTLCWAKLYSDTHAALQ
ncbi:MAG TPA: TM0106 family RecB-like putative nuclease [Rhizomicrobium sp.]|jgi:predicted RecB family nuclease|nr:TM0106 family RecB-like putative nuclease [Rhizomicrobium sp.]